MYLISIYQGNHSKSNPWGWGLGNLENNHLGVKLKLFKVNIREAYPWEVSFNDDYPNLSNCFSIVS